MQSPRFEKSTWLPTFYNSRLHLGFFIALVLALIIYLLLWKTAFGYEIRAIGDNPIAAKYKGIKIGHVVIGVMLIYGSTAMQIFADVPVALVYCVQGIVLICVLAIDPLTYYHLRRVPK